MNTTEQAATKPKTKLKQKRKKTRYKTGIHVSSKCSKPVAYRSSWEKAVCCYLDENELVRSYSYESIVIPYKSNIRSSRIRRYYPDFLVEYTDGQRKLVEVKRENQLNNPFVKKKAEAALLWCTGQPNLKYEFWTEKLIRPLLKLYQLQTPPKKKAPKKKKTTKTNKKQLLT